VVKNADIKYNLVNNSSENRYVDKYFVIKWKFLRINEGIGGFYE